MPVNLPFDLPPALEQWVAGVDPTVLGFVTCASLAFVVAMLVVWGRSVVAEPEVATEGVRRNGRGLRRRTDVFDQPEANSMFGRIDQGFDRMVLESGLEMSPVTAFMGIIAVGLLVGGSVYVARETEMWAYVSAVMAMIVTLVAIEWRRRRRIQKIRETLPDALDLLARGVRAGESLDQAIRMVGRETRGPLGHEFTKVSKQLDMGMSMSSVVRSMANRVRIVEMRMVASTLSVHREVGGNLALAMDRMAHVIRERLTYLRQIRSATTAGRTSALIIAAVTPAAYLLMFTWQPRHFGILWTDPLGRTLLLVAVILEIVGIFWVLRLLKHD